MKNLYALLSLALLVGLSCSSRNEKSDVYATAEESGYYDSSVSSPIESSYKLENQTEEQAMAKEIDIHTISPANKKLIKTAEIKFRVKNVWSATEKIEDLASKYQGYITFSNLQNRFESSAYNRITRDSVLVTSEIVVVNQMKIRIPNVKLDSFVRELNPLVTFLDFRIIKMEDVTYKLELNQLKANRFEKYQKRQQTHIDARDNKLKDATVAEDNLYDRQLQADEIAIKTKEFYDKLKYCDIDLEIYQKPVITGEIKADFNYVSTKKPNFFIRLLDAIIQGYTILEEIVLFVIKIWGILLLGIGLLVLIRFLLKINKKE